VLNLEDFKLKKFKSKKPLGSDLVKNEEDIIYRLEINAMKDIFNIG
jgi:hypothetical protein